MIAVVLPCACSECFRSRRAVWRKEERGCVWLCLVLIHWGECRNLSRSLSLSFVLPRDSFIFPLCTSRDDGSIPAHTSRRCRHTKPLFTRCYSIEASKPKLTNWSFNAYCSHVKKKRKRPPCKACFFKWKVTQLPGQLLSRGCLSTGSLSTFQWIWQLFFPDSLCLFRLTDSFEVEQPL